GTMSRLTLDISMSLDGFITGPDPGPEQPLGAGGDRLHEWVYPLATFRERHGLTGGTTNRDSEVVDESIRDTGAYLMGRRMSGGEEGPWGDEPRGRLVGRGRSLPCPGVSARPPRAGAGDNARRSDVHLRHRRHPS